MIYLLIYLLIYLFFYLFIYLLILFIHFFSYVISAYPSSGLMSAEGILADPCLFYRQSDCVSGGPCTKDNYLHVSNYDVQNNLSRSDCSPNFAKKRNFTSSEMIVDKSETENENIEIKEIEYLANIPDRASLFAEYCYLSDLFLSAGGWRGLEIKDYIFDENNVETANDDGDDKSKVEDNEKRKETLNDEKINRNNNSNNDDDNYNNKNHIDKSSNFKNNINNYDNDYYNNNRNVQYGHQKQIETAKQHLFWMLEKKGHGRTVRFVHLGNYKKHTDLLNEIKNKNNLLDLVLISNICLRGVYGSNVYSNDNYY